jgi:hypothetical protein
LRAFVANNENDKSAKKHHQKSISYLLHPITPPLNHHRLRFDRFFKPLVPKKQKKTKNPHQYEKRKK